MEPAVIAFEGELSMSRYPEVHGLFESAKLSKGRPLVLDLSAAADIDQLIAAEIVLFVRRTLRYGAAVAILPPPSADWLTRAESIRDAQFCTTREEAFAAVGAAPR